MPLSVQPLQQNQSVSGVTTAQPQQSLDVAQPTPQPQIASVGPVGAQQAIQRTTKGNIIPDKLPVGYAQQLTGIVQQMANDGQSDDNIKTVINDYKTKYADGDLKLQAQLGAEDRQRQANIDQYGVANPGIADKFDSTVLGGLGKGLTQWAIPALTGAYNVGAGLADLATGKGTDTAIQDMNATRDVPFYGETAPLGLKQPGQGALQSFLQAGGEGIQAGLSLSGLGEADAAEPAVSEATSGTNKLLSGQGIKQVAGKVLSGVKTGGAIGATFGTGAGLQDPNTYGGGFVKGVENVGKQAFVTGVLGAATGGLTEGLGAVHDIKANAATSQVANAYGDALNMTKNDRAYESAKGYNSPQLAQELGLNQSKISDNTLDTTGDVQTVQQNRQEVNSALSDLLKSEAKQVNVEDLRAKALNYIDQTESGTAVDTAKAKVNAEIKAYAKQYGTKSGDQTFISLDKLNDIKQDTWGKGYSSKFDDETSSNTKKGFRAIGGSARRMIEENSNSDLVHYLNQRDSQLSQLEDMLKKANGNKIKGSGPLSKALREGVGAVAGVHFGPFGPLIGAKLADFISGSFSDGTVGQSAIDNFFGRVAEHTNHPDELVGQVKNIVAQRQAESANRPQIPAPSSLRQPAASGNVNGGQFYANLKDIPNEKTTLSPEERANPNTKNSKVIQVKGESKSKPVTQIFGDTKPGRFDTKATALKNVLKKSKK